MFLSPLKGQGQSFKCKLTEFVSWDFRYFWFQCKVNGKFGISVPNELIYVLQRNFRIEFLALTYPFIEISNHTILPQEVTCFHMSKVHGCLDVHPSWINLYLHLELSWIWVEIFFAFVNFFCERNHLVSYHFFLKYLVCTLIYHRT